MSKTEEPMEKPESKVIEMPGQEEKPKPKWYRRRLFLWTFGSILGVIVLSGAGYGVYEYHRHQMMSVWDQAGQTALAQGQYNVAVQDFQKALSYANSPDVESHLQNAKNLVASQQAFQNGQSAMSAGDWSTAIADFQKVIPADKKDYSSAQQLLRQANSVIALSKVLNDMQQFNSYASSLINDINTLANEGNQMVNDEWNLTSLSNDVQAYSNAESTFSSDVSALQSTIASVNTDAQPLSDNANKDISSVISDLEQQLNLYENAATDIGNIVASVLTQAQRIESGSYGMINLSGTTWSSDISTITSEMNAINNDVAKLKAYQPAQAQNSNT